MNQMTRLINKTRYLQTEQDDSVRDMRKVQPIKNEMALIGEIK